MNCLTTKFAKPCKAFSVIAR